MARGPGAETCPVCDSPRSDVLAELKSAAATHRRSLQRFSAALEAAAYERVVDVVRCTGLPETTARRWLQQGPPDPWKTTR